MGLRPRSRRSPSLGSPGVAVTVAVVLLFLSLTLTSFQPVSATQPKEVGVETEKTPTNESIFASLEETSSGKGMERKGKGEEMSFQAMEQLARLLVEEEKCKAMIRNSTQLPDDAICPIVWDGALCWVESQPDHIQNQSCPTYVHGFNHSAFATRSCTVNSTWQVSESTNASPNQGWTNYSLCTPQLTAHEGINNSKFEPHIENIQLITKMGYSVSLGTLVVAFFILTFNKYANSSPEGHNFVSLTNDDGQITFVERSDTMSCKIFTVVWQYSLLANYNWILMEGLYLHNLIFLHIFSDNSSIVKYIVLGWGLPLIFIIPWTVVRALYEDHLCWTTNETTSYFWIIRGPITASIILNFIFFINITRVLFLKMFAPNVHSAHANGRYKYSNWFKSTLVLVPLFGVHYTFLLVFNSLSSFSHDMEIVWLYVDLLFTSFQGFFVALLYCFLNGEVQQEVRKMWRNWCSSHGSNSQPPSHSTTYHSILAQSLTYLGRGRNSILPESSCRKESNPKSSRSPSPPPNALKKESTSGPFLHPDHVPLNSTNGSPQNGDILLRVEPRPAAKGGDAECGSTESVL